MNSIGTLALLYFLMTLGSATVLFFSFKSSIDISGRYFLLAESLMLLTIGQVVITNFDPTYIGTVSLLLGNWFGVSSEIAIFFSIYSLSRSIKVQQYILVVILSGIYCSLIEYLRGVDASLPIALYAGLSFFLAVATFWASRSHDQLELRSNQFLRWIGYLELALACFALLRIFSYFMGAPIGPRNPTTTNTVLFAVFIALSLFRYVSYQSFRISWVGTDHGTSNLLNQNLLKIQNEKNQLLQRLISSNRALGISALASSLAHQLSQPLTGIALQTEIVKRDLAKSASHQSAVSILNSVGEQLGKLSELVNNLRRLFVAREHDWVVINLQKITDQVLEIIEPTLQSRKITFIKSYESNPDVLGNAIQIQQVIINIINNAIDAVISAKSAVPKISLRIFDEEGRARLVIEDSGAGISPEAFQTLFELYKTTKPDGLGLGLWLSQTIVDKHQGRITARNGASGGAKFEIELPVVHHKGESGRE